MKLRKFLMNIKEDLENIVYDTKDNILVKENTIILVNRNLIKLIVFVESGWNENLSQILYSLHSLAKINVKKMLGYKHFQIVALMKIIELVIGNLNNMKDNTYSECIELLETEEMEYVEGIEIG